MGSRQCPHCGKYVPDVLDQCPQCRETLPPAVHGHLDPEKARQGRHEIRKGLVWMLVAAVTRKYVVDYPPIVEQVPEEVLDLTQLYLVPFLFLLGAGLVVLGVYHWISSKA